MTISPFLARLARDQHGTSAVEYALILSLITLAMVSALSGFGNAIQITWNNVNTQTSSAVSQATAGA